MNAPGKQAFRAVFVFIVVTLLSSPVSAHVEKGHMPDAVAEVEYKILLEFKPQDLDARTKLALVLIRQGKLDEAAKELETASTQSPDDYRVHEGYIVLKLKEQKVKEALTIAEKSLRSSPEIPILYLHYGNALLADGQSAKALETYRTGLAKTTDDKNSHDREQLEAAIKKVNSALTQTAVNAN